MPIEACRDGGSLPATSKERGSASALRWPWRNRKSASDIRNRRRAHRRRDFVSGHPQSAMGTRGSASAGRFLAPKTDSQPSLEAPRPKPPGPWIRTWESECTGPAGQPLGPARTPPLKPATGQQAPPTRRFKRADRAVHHRKRNRMMARTKRVRRSYGAGEWGRNRVTGVSRSQDRLVPDRVARERAQAHPVAASIATGGRRGGRRTSSPPDSPGRS